MKLPGKVALITGGGTGLGTAFARRFVKEGAKVCITGRRKELLDKTAASLPKGSVVTFAGDVSKTEDAQEMVDTTIEFGGRIDILINNAGIDPPGSVVETPVEQWRRIIDITTLRCIPAMAAYVASKAGLIGLTQQAALDYGPSKIRCNAVCPGAIRTEMLEHAMTPLSQALKTDIAATLLWMTRFTPLKRPATPEEVSGIVVYLASDDSSFMTGAVLPIDGGACIVDPNGSAVASAGMGWGGGK